MLNLENLPQLSGLSLKNTSPWLPKSLDDWKDSYALEQIFLERMNQIKAQEEFTNKRGFKEDYARGMAAISPYDRIALKRFVHINLAKRSGLALEDVKMFIKAWAIGTSSRPDYLALHTATAEEFGLEIMPFVEKTLMRYPHPKLYRVPDMRDKTFFKTAYWKEMVLKAHQFIEANYQSGQELFAQAGIKEVIAFRGVGWPEAKVPAAFKDWDLIENLNKTIELTMALNPLAPFSGSAQIGAVFAHFFYKGTNAEEYRDVGVILSGKIPVERIISTPLTGFGCFTESELVVIGGELHLSATPKSAKLLERFTSPRLGEYQDQGWSWSNLGA